MRRIVSSLVVACALLAGCLLAEDIGSTGSPATPFADAADAAQSADGSTLPLTDARVDSPDAANTRDGGTASDAMPDTAQGATGPGPFGALPSGYCCERDDDCRFRKCVDTGTGGKMCLDECSSSRPGMCTRPDLAFSCAPLGDAGNYCQPSAGFACIAAGKFERGTASTGACCGDTRDGTAGQECEANLCLALENDSWFCTRRCTAPSDCPPNFQCYPVGDRSECIPDSVPYTCR